VPATAAATAATVPALTVLAVLAVLAALAVLAVLAALAVLALLNALTTLTACGSAVADCVPSHCVIAPCPELEKAWQLGRCSRPLSPSANLNLLLLFYTATLPSTA
jgi:hypothetical protein